MQMHQAGSIQLQYENGFLRYLKFGDTEVLRMIYFALRDENWGTLENIIQDEKISFSDHTFTISYRCLNKKDGEDIFHWEVNIEGQADGTVTFELHGEALVNVKKNRAGFCVLHPLTCAGAPAEISHTDGHISTKDFPEFIDPENPFKNIRSMRWKSAGTWFTLHFEGDIFETEDQRNWSDASFKTFCTPLDLPFPVELKKGTKVDQKVTFKPESTKTITYKHEAVQLQTSSKSFSLPLLGLDASSHDGSLPKEAVSAIKALHLNHYRIDVHPDKENWIRDFSAACEIAVALGLQIEAAVHTTDKSVVELEAFTMLCLQNKLPIFKVLMLSETKSVTSQTVVDQIENLKSQLPRVEIGAGTNYNFTELNRNRFDATGADFISYALQPQEHAFDNKSIVETLQAQADTLRSAQNIYKGKSIHVSPVSLKKRFNPYASDESQKVLTEEQRTDDRQQSPFNAAWTLGSILHLAISGATAVTYHQTAGPLGIIGLDGKRYPVYEAVKTLNALGSSFTLLQSSKPLLIEGMRFQDVYLIWNYTERVQDFVLGERSGTLNPFEIRTIAV